VATILIIDDRPINRAFLVTLLGYHGHRLVEAADGTEGLVVARAVHPDLVITDILMPTMDGYEFVRRLRADPALTQTPVVFWSAYYLEQEAHALAQACGVAYLLVKPCEPEEILRTVDVALGHAPTPATAPPETFDREHLQVLTDKLSRTVEELSMVNGKLSALVETSRRLALERDLPQLLEDCCRAARDILGAQWVVIGMQEDDGTTFRHWATAGLTAEMTALLGMAPLQQGVFSELLHGRSVCRLHEVGGAPPALGLPPGSPLIRALLGATIASPLRIYGCLVLANKLGAEAFSKEDEHLATTLAAQVAVAYENASLYTALEQHAAELGHAVAEYQRTEGRLRRAEARYRTLIEQLPVITYTTALEPSGRTVYISPQVEALLGYTPTEWRANPQIWTERIHPEDRERVAASRAASSVAGQPCRMEYRLRARDGHEVWVHDEGLVIKDEDKEDQRFQGILLDISERKRAEAAHAALEQRVAERTRDLMTVNASLQHEIRIRQRMEEQLRHDALHDALTGLPNRPLFLDRLAQVLARAKRQAPARCAVLFLDLDHFKLINDSLGHQAGDHLLVALARRLQRCVRGSDTVARLGGDEFALLLDALHDDRDYVQVAHRIHQALTQPFLLNGQEVFTNGSMGIALMSPDYTIPGDLLRDADIALYHAKTQGRGRYAVFDTAMRSRIVERVQTETALRRALEQHEFLVYYQPIVSLPTGRLAGFEALVRWQHAERGLLLPGEFIPIAEETGLIVPLGRWVLTEACRQIQAWHRQGLTTAPLRISVNLSGKQVAYPGLLAEIQAMVRETDLGPHGLTLEITESVLIEHGHVVMDLFASLHAMGIQLGLDDFGTGYSSLSYLHHFPIDLLKIDRAFIHTIDREGKDRELVKAILAIAQTLHVATIAEGVETATHLAALRTLGCPYGQGYHFSRPVASAIAEAFITQPPPW